jgi:hypothetical protein
MFARSTHDIRFGVIGGRVRSKVRFASTTVPLSETKDAGANGYSSALEWH